MTYSYQISCNSVKWLQKWGKKRKHRNTYNGARSAPNSNMNIKSGCLKSRKCRPTLGGNYTSVHNFCWKPEPPRLITCSVWTETHRVPFFDARYRFMALWPDPLQSRGQHLWFVFGRSQVQISARKQAIVIQAVLSPAGKCRESTSNYATIDSFHIHSNLQFTNHSAIRPYIVRVTNRAVK
jgi:hypothetical protein